MLSIAPERNSTGIINYYSRSCHIAYNLPNWSERGRVSLSVTVVFAYTKWSETDPVSRASKLFPLCLCSVSPSADWVSVMEVNNLILPSQGCNTHRVQKKSSVFSFPEIFHFLCLLNDAQVSVIVSNENTC